MSAQPATSALKRPMPGTACRRAVQQSVSRGQAELVRVAAHVRTRPHIRPAYVGRACKPGSFASLHTSAHVRTSAPHMWAVLACGQATEIKKTAHIVLSVLALHRNLASSSGMIALKTSPCVTMTATPGPGAGDALM